MELAGTTLQNKTLRLSRPSALHRHFLKMLLRILKNGEHEYINWQLVGVLDQLLEEEVVKVM
jgi:hypothetical protein